MFGVEACPVHVEVDVGFGMPCFTMVGLPDASGYELMQQMQSRQPLKGIALSGYGMEEDIRKSREAGFVEHVTKPVNVEHLMLIIDRVTETK